MKYSARLRGKIAAFGLDTPVAVSACEHGNVFSAFAAVLRQKFEDETQQLEAAGNAVDTNT